MSKKFIVFLIFAVLFLGLIPACGASAPTGTGLVEGNHVGSMAYDFSLQGPTGVTVTLSSLRGYPVILNFWYIECSYCVEEFPLLQSLYQQEAAQVGGAVILALNINDNAQAVQNFMSSNGYTLPVLMDTGANVAAQYGVPGTPTTFFINSAGVIQYIQIGGFASLSQIQTDLGLIT